MSSNEFNKADTYFLGKVSTLFDIALMPQGIVSYSAALVPGRLFLPPDEYKGIQSLHCRYSGSRRKYGKIKTK